MKFFIPGQSDETKAEELYKGIKMFAKDNVRWDISDRRIFSLDFRDQGKPCHVEVGKRHPITGEIVVAILDSNCYLVCTPNRGVARGMPLLVGKQEVSWVVDFET